MGETPRQSALRLPTLQLRLEARPEVWEIGDDGSFSAMVDFEAFLLLERRPHEESEWESDDLRPSCAWTQDGWDWRLRGPEELAASELDSIRAQLSEPRPDEG
ncbi:hypothetical protein [Aeromicrobium sp. Root472D3]|uniref:hypothetical protein n=1 Tax=Aeromicrobium sp. Root472D3 TaxID=1736540 RepID=UPI000701B114|nr:hypothetical protein [Aeromicrobium sp. Root472D3]KQX75651.1 hypothetical protein ASD10_10965 [Aeromicrobium sp. Root472D3]